MPFKLLPRSPDLFVGREEEIRTLEQYFTKAHIFFIKGITGIGKTSLMLKWANILADREEFYNKVIWIKCQQDWTIENLLLDVNEWLLSLGDESLQDKLCGKPISIEDKILMSLKSLNDGKYLLFIDDYHNISGEDSTLFLQHLNQYFRGKKAYFTSRVSPPLSPLEKMEIFEMALTGMTADDGLKLVKDLLVFQQISRPMDKESLQEIVEKASGHPLLLRSFVGLLISKSTDLDQLLSEIHEMKKDVTNLIFEKMLEDLSEEEFYNLKILSTLRISASGKHMGEICQSPDSEIILADLYDRMLVQKDETASYFVQNLLKDQIWKDLQDEDKIHLHTTCAAYYEESAKRSDQDNIWQLRESYYHWVQGKQIDKASKIFELLMGKICSCGLIDEFSEKVKIFENTPYFTPKIQLMKANALSLRGKWEESLQMLQNLEGQVEDKNIIAEVYSSLGGTYLNVSHFKMATIFYEKALAIFRKLKNPERINKILNYLASIYAFIGLTQKARAITEESLAIAVKEKNNIGIGHAMRAKSRFLLEELQWEKAFSAAEECFKKAQESRSARLTCWGLNLKGEALSLMGKFEEAQQCFDEMFEQSEKSKDTLVGAFAYYGMGILNYEKGALNEAVEVLDKSINLYSDFGNKLGIASSLYYIALIKLEQNSNDKAEDILKRVLEMAEEYGHFGLEVDSALKTARIKLIADKKEEAEEILEALKNNPNLPLLPFRSIEYEILSAELHFKKNQNEEVKKICKNALALSLENNFTAGIAAASYILSKIVPKESEQSEINATAMENFAKLQGSMQRYMKKYFKYADEIFQEKYIIKTNDQEYSTGLTNVERTRESKDKFAFWMDMQNQELIIKGLGEVDIFKKRIPLSILFLLAKNAGKSVSPAEIYKTVWGWEYNKETCAGEIRKNISRLRSLVEPDRDNLKYILLKEGYLKEKGKYFFGDEDSFCLIYKEGASIEE